MSLIHEALEKVGQEKKGEKRKQISEVLERDSIAPSGTVPVEKEKNPFEENAKAIYWIAGVLMILFIAGMVYLLIRTPALPPAEEPTSLSPAATVPSAKLQRGLSLTGVTRAGEEWTAIINNRLVRVGDWVSGARVEAIEDRQVTLDIEGRKVTLNLY